MDEYWDICDRDRRLTGGTLRRGDPMTTEEYHLVVRVWIRSGDDRWLISRRAPEKTYPYRGEPTVGSALTGESSLDAALREVYEELGIRLRPEEGRLKHSLRRDKLDRPDFLDAWVFEHDCDIADMTLQPGETSGVKWVTAEKIRQMMKSKAFVPADDLGPHADIIGPVKEGSSWRSRQSRFTESSAWRAASCAWGRKP